jgi:hypothetical protein
MPLPKETGVSLLFSQPLPSLPLKRHRTRGAPIKTRPWPRDGQAWVLVLPRMDQSLMTEMTWATQAKQSPKPQGEEIVTLTELSRGATTGGEML